MFTQFSLPNNLRLQYKRINRLLKPDVKSEITRIVKFLRTPLLRLPFPQYYSRMISASQQAFPHLSKADLNVVRFQILCEQANKAIEAAEDIRDRAKAGAANAKELHKAALSLLKEVQERQDANVAAMLC